MKLTIVVDDDILKRARIRALRENTSLNAVVRSYLVTYAGSIGSATTPASGCWRFRARPVRVAARRSGVGTSCMSAKHRQKIGGRDILNPFAGADP